MVEIRSKTFLPTPYQYPRRASKQGHLEKKINQVVKKMAGKKKKSENTNGWGGKRPGSGRKSTFELNEEQLKEYLCEVKKLCKEKGVSPISFLFSVMNNELDGVQGGVELKSRVMTAITLLKFNQLNIKQENINITDTRGPAIYLPEMKPDPAKLIPIKGGKKMEDVK
jgi:hypothetical protein